MDNSSGYKVVRGRFFFNFKAWIEKMAVKLKKTLKEENAGPMLRTLWVDVAVF